jgi:hypothetical protein
MANCLQPAIAFAAQLIDLAVQASDYVHGLVDRSAKLGVFALPPANAVDLSGSSAHLCVDLVAQLALCACWNRLHDELHAARLTHAILLGTVLAEVAPLPVATGKTVLIVEAHVSKMRAGVRCLTTC